MPNEEREKSRYRVLLTETWGGRFSWQVIDDRAQTFLSGDGLSYDHAEDAVLVARRALDVRMAPEIKTRHYIQIYEDEIGLSCEDAKTEGAEP